MGRDCKDCGAMYVDDDHVEACPETIADRLMAANRTAPTTKFVLGCIACGTDGPCAGHADDAEAAIDFVCGKLDRLIAASAWSSCLAANLRTAGALALAWQLGVEWADSDSYETTSTEWAPNVYGLAALRWTP